MALKVVNHPHSVGNILKKHSINGFVDVFFNVSNDWMFHSMGFPSLSINGNLRIFFFTKFVGNSDGFPFFFQSNDSVDFAPVQWSPILRLLDALVLVPFPLAKNSSFSGLCRVLEVEQRPEKSRFPRLIGLWFCTFSRFSRFQIPDRIVVLWFSLGIAPQVWICECLWLPHSNAFPRWRYPDYGHLTLGDLGRLL